MRMDHNSSLISIIVPVYNSQYTLKKCVNSLLDQDYSNIEIILVNDGSQDDSLLLCDELKSVDSRITVITQHNSGVSTARNNGVKAAKGEWLCFVDSDDFIEKTFISDFGLDDENGSSTVYLQGYQHNFEEKSDIIYVHEKRGIYNLKKEAEVLFESTNFVFQGTVCSKLYNRKVILDNNIFFNKKMRLNEDNCFFWDYVSRIERVIISDTCGYHYMHAEGINYSKSHKSSKEYLYIMQENKAKLNALYDTFNVRHGTYYSRNYSFFVINTWLHALVAFFNEPGVTEYDYKALMKCSYELKTYTPKGFLLNTLKIVLSVIMIFPFKIEFLCLKLFSRWVYRSHVFSI